jgi:hypothetical protein
MHTHVEHVTHVMTDLSYSGIIDPLGLFDLCESFVLGVPFLEGAFKRRRSKRQRLYARLADSDAQGDAGGRPTYAWM